MKQRKAKHRTPSLYLLAAWRVERKFKRGGPVFIQDMYEMIYVYGNPNKPFKPSYENI